MINVENLRVIEKPESISYETIHEVLWRANEPNRRDGFILATSKLSGEQIKEKLHQDGNEGRCFVALYNGEVVGTMSLLFKKRYRWYVKGKIAEFVLAGVLPEYQGNHILSFLFEKAFDLARKEGCIAIELNTAEQNTKAIKAYNHFGFELIDYKANRGGDHYSVVMMKWFGNRPHSDLYMKLRYFAKKVYIKIRYTQSKEKRWNI